MEFCLQEQKPMAYTSKQLKILSDLDQVINKEGVQIEINPKDTARFRQQIVALDVEHDESGGFVGLGLYSGSGPVCYFSDRVRCLDIDFPSLAIVAHNGISDLDCLRTWGINVSNEQLYWDTMLLGHLADSSLKSYSLKDMAKRELDISYPSYDEIVGRRGLKSPRITLEQQPQELVAKYNAMDVWSTWKLYERQKNYANL